MSGGVNLLFQVRLTLVRNHGSDYYIIYIPLIYISYVKIKTNKRGVCRSTGAVGNGGFVTFGIGCLP